MIISTRAAVFELLRKIEDDAYSNLVLDKYLSKSEFSSSEKAFVSRLFYGTIERKITLDYIISLYSSKPLKKLDSEIVIILRLAYYQLLFMDSVPDNAAVNEAVKLVKSAKKTSASGFVNAVLRKFIRDEKKYKLPVNDVDRISVQYSCSKELVEKLLRQYDDNTAEKFLADSLSKHTTFIRVNSLKTTADELIKTLSDEKIIAEKHSFLDDCLVVSELRALENCKAFSAGLFYVQDLSSQLCCKALDISSGEKLYDSCSAPGGKSFTLALMSENNAEIYSADLHKHRVQLIEKNAEKLGISSITAFENDSSVHNYKLPVFDKILCDVPCSGTGVIRTKPEIKYSSLAKLKTLTALQTKILETSARYLKIGGELIYSTCSVLREENDEIIDSFLKNNSDFEAVPFLAEIGEPFGDYKAVIFPENFGCEGFFISKIRRIK